MIHDYVRGTDSNNDAIDWRWVEEVVVENEKLILSQTWM